MPRAEIVDAKLHYCGRMARNLRHEHAASFLRLGLNGHRSIRQTLAMSTGFRRALLLDGVLAGMWGVCGSAMSPFGNVWVVFTQDATRYPILLVKETRRQLDEMMILKNQLVTTVFEGDHTAMRFAAFLGFHVDGELEGAPAFSKGGRKRLVRYALNNPDLRFQAGTGFCVRFGYQPVAA